MRAWQKAVGQIVAMLAIIVLAVQVAGCKSTRNLSETEMQARLRTVSEAVRLAQIQSGRPVIADFLSSVPKSGAAGYTSSKRAVRDKDGQPVLLNGVVQFEEQLAVGLANSMREFGAVNEAYFVLGGWGVNPKTGDIQTNATVDGLYLWLTGPGGSSGLDSEFASVWANATPAEKTAAANAVKLAVEARKGLIVEGITAAGEVAKGVLKEVYSATPLGQAAAAVQVLLEKLDGSGTVAATITEAYTTLPASGCTGDGCSETAQ